MKTQPAGKPRAQHSAAAHASRIIGGKPAREFMRFIEEHAAILRQRAAVGPLDPFDPRTLTKDFKLMIALPDDIEQISAEDRQVIANMEVSTWSGAGLPLPGGWFLVLLHPSQTRERATVTIMEEVAHAYFGHKPSRLIRQATGLVTREYDAIAEQEAYWTAGATLLPSVVVAKAVWHGQSAATLAAAYGVSTELAEMRIKTLRLWHEHRVAPGVRERRAG